MEKEKNSTTLLKRIINMLKPKKVKQKVKVKKRERWMYRNE